MPALKHCVFAVLALAVATAVRANDVVPPLDPKGVEFFESKIRPVLVQHCYECHSVGAATKGKLKGELRLDSRDAMRGGGESGPAVVPGKPDEGSLIGALRYDTFQMPPKRKLPEAVVADFVKWIEMGAPDPRTETAPKPVKKGIDIAAGKQFWSYQQPRTQVPPEVKNSAWPRGDIDRFVLAKLEANKLSPVRDADRAALCRRLYFDLIGLPPTPEQLDEFLSDSSPQAVETLVDRLLGSQHFGERWARHWLDVSRYAESLTLRGFVLKDAWRYRDYVIGAFNSDLPYHQFVREQIAGDLLLSEGDSLEVRRQKMAATSFLAIGNTNLEEQDKQMLVMDVVDEQIDTIGKAFLAQTIGCARCHDHKFDPIPTRDYYGLAGILKNSKTLEHSNVSKWLEVPLPMTADAEAAVKAHAEKVADLKKQIDAEKKLAKADGKRESKNDDNPKKRGQPIAVADVVGIVVDDAKAKKIGDWTHSQHTRAYVGEGYIHDGGQEKGAKTITFDPDIPATGKYEVRFSYSASAGRATNVPLTVFSADGEKTVIVDESETPNIDGLFVSLGQYRFEVAGQSFVLLSTEGTKGVVTADSVVFVPVEKLTDPSPVVAKKNDEPQTPSTVDPAKLKALEDELKRLEKAAPRRDTVISVVEQKQVEDLRIHVRGSVKNLGDRVPRGFLQVATTGEIAPLPKEQSGRRELADWLVAESNPLTARVMANRVWHWLFGAGLVRSTDNFGVTGEQPSHPELLDHLAVTFMRDGWSMKRLIRQIVLSRTYQLSIENRAENLAADPENRLVWRMNRRRLEGECIRDAMLSMSGMLDVTPLGPSFDTSLNSDFGFQHKDVRRSVYSPAFRNSMLEIFEVFDAADASLVTGRRNVSTVAPQALFLMNHPFVLEQSRATAQRLLKETHPDVDSRLKRAYRVTLGREPTNKELALMKNYLTASSDKELDRWSSVVQTLFGSIEFRYSN